MFRRTGHKYRDRTYRYVLADLGHALENLRVAAGALGVAGALRRRVRRGPAAAALGVDEAEEGVLAVVGAVRRTGRCRVAAAPARALGVAASRWLPRAAPARIAPPGARSA